MPLSREDRLRELELLPVWRLKAPLVEPRAVPSATDAKLPAEDSPLATLANSSTAHAERAVLIDTPAQSVATPIAAPTSEAIGTAPIQNQSMSIAALPTALTAEVTIPTATASAPVNLPLIQTPWLVYAPGATDADSQALLVNILKAMRLPPEARTLQLQPVALVQVAVQQMVIFGLAAANQLLGTRHEQLSDLRGQVFKLDAIRYVVTHHPHEMLSHPACKKAVWYDLCLLLGQKA